MSVPPLEGKHKIWSLLSHDKRILATSQECKITVIKIVFSPLHAFTKHVFSLFLPLWTHKLVIIELKARCWSAVLFFHIAGVVLIILVASRDAVSCGRLSCCSLSVQTMRRQSSGMRNEQPSQHSDWLNQTQPISPRHPAMQWNCLLICIVLFFYILCINMLFSLLVSSLFSQNIHFLPLHFCVHSSFALWQPETFKNIPFHFIIKVDIFVLFLKG